ncbi:voltage-gated potassium channel KCNC1 isoform X1 [Pogona vitticeps]
MWGGAVLQVFVFNPISVSPELNRLGPFLIYFSVRTAGDRESAQPMKPNQEKVTLNIGGIRYETYTNTLRALPGTKLCRLTEPQASHTFDYNPDSKEFFFDRNAALFEEVLNYYRTQRLHCPAAICRSVLEEELAFWEIPHVPLAPCCGWRLTAAEEQQGACNLWDDEERQNEGQDLGVQREGGHAGWRTRWQPQIWPLFENPHSSLGAKCLAAVSLLFNISICILFLWKINYSIYQFFPPHSFGSNNRSSTYNHPENTVHERFPNHLYLELFHVLWFIVEFFMRFTFCPMRKKFLKSPLNVTDFLSLFPVFIELFSHGHVSKNEHLEYFFGFFRMVYLFKLLKMIKLVETPLMFKILSYTSRCLLREFLILIMIFVLEALFFGALCYCSETIFFGHIESYFWDMPSSFWWAVITLTTVGYGDIVPVTSISRVIGACTALCGVLTLIVPIPIFVIKFKGYYDAALLREKMKRLRKQTPSPSS